MDPNECLARIRELVARVNALRDADEHGDHFLVMVHAYDLAEHVEALDDWIRGGGFLPLGWKRPYLGETP